MSSTTTLLELKNERLGAPYTKSVRIKVITVGDPKKFRDQSGEEKSCLNVGVADNTASAKVAVYDPSKYPRFVEGATLIVRNVITKPFGFVVSQQTRICPTASMDVPEAMRTAARDIIRPPAAPVEPLNVAMRSPPKQRVSVAGKILMEEDKHEVMVKNNTATIKNIYIQDASVKRCKVALWRDYANADIKPGDYVTITDVVTNIYRNETSLQTTSFTNIQKSDAPEMVQEYTVEGVCEEGEMIIFLIVDDTEVLEIQKDIVETALNAAQDEVIEDVEGYLSEKCQPVMRVKTTSKGSTITELSFIDL